MGKNGASAPPSILQQPVSGTNYVGSSRTISVGAGGTEPLTYLWTKNGQPSGGNTNALVFSNLQLTDAGVYAVTVTNLLGSMVSSDATIGVLAHPTEPYAAMIVAAHPDALLPIGRNQHLRGHRSCRSHQLRGLRCCLRQLPVAGARLSIPNGGTAITLDGFSQLVSLDQAEPGIVGNITLEASIKPQDTNAEA